MHPEDTEDLQHKHCEPCEGKVQPFGLDEATRYLKQVEGWELDMGGAIIRRTFQMNNFLDAVSFIQDMAQVAEAENHHPDFHLTAYRTLTIELSTHAIGGLSENDFILAAKIDQLRPATG